MRIPAAACASCHSVRDRAHPAASCVFCHSVRIPLQRAGRREVGVKFAMRLQPRWREVYLAVWQPRRSVILRPGSGRLPSGVVRYPAASCPILPHRAPQGAASCVSCHSVRVMPQRAYAAASYSFAAFVSHYPTVGVRLALCGC